MADFWNNVSSHLETRHGTLLAYWTGSSDAMPQASVEAHCDVVYSLLLLGRIETVSPKAVDGFVTLLAGLHLPGWQKRGEEASISVHNCAYAFGALNVLANDPSALYQRVLAGRSQALDQLIDPHTNVPVFPPKWAHHNWRVSHWIGGVPSIIVSIANSRCTHAPTFAALITPVREAADALVDKRTGLLRAYRSDLVQKLFRTAYAIRHDPDLGDVGGVAHLLWIDHVLGRKYVALPALLAHARTLFHKHDPFMEGAPYCLDFDIVQAVRTAADQADGIQQAADRQRATKMAADIEAFFAAGPGETYTLHKLTGALATYHECLLLLHPEGIVQDGVAAIDIIKRANWL